MTAFQTRTSLGLLYDSIPDLYFVRNGDDTEQIITEWLVTWTETNPE